MKLAAYKRLFNTAKSRSGRRPISVATLLKKHETADLRKHSSQVGQSELLYRDGDSPGVTGSPAKAPRKKGDVPDMDGGDQTPKAESRQDVSGGALAESGAGVEAIDKSAERLSLDRALGDQRKGWEGPTREEMGRSMPEKHTGTGPFTRLSDISSSVGQDESKTATLNGFVDEIQKLASIATRFETWAKKHEDKSKIHHEQEMRNAAVTGGVLSSAIPLLAAPESVDAVLGIKTLRHGTSKDNAAKIRQSGFQPSFGGTGGAAKEGRKDYVEASKNKIHMADRSGVLTPRMYASLGGLPEGASPDFNDALGLNAHKGDVVTARIPYHRFKETFERDTTMPTMGAFHSSKAIEPQHVVGPDTSTLKSIGRALPSLSNSLKHPGRRVAGLAGLAAVPAGALLSKKLFSVAKSRNEKARGLAEEFDKKYAAVSDQEKLAAAKPKEPEKTKNPAGAVAAYSGLVGAGVATNSLGKSVRDHHQIETPGVFDKIKAESPVPVNTNAASDQFAPYSNFKVVRDQQRALGMEPGSVNVRRHSGAAILGHEVGHAKIDATRVGRLVQNIGTNAAAKFAPHVGLAAGLATGGSDDKNVRRWGVLAPTLMTVPQLGYEGAASISALRDLKRHGASPAALRSAKSQLGKAWGTYAGRASTAPLAAYLGQSARSRNREEPKTAAVSDQAVMDSVKRLDKLEQDKPTMGQVGRSAGVGAALGPVASLAQRAIAGRKAAGGLGPYRGPRDLAASAVHGAIAGGFVPVLRRSVDQHAEKKTIKNYLNQQGQ